MKREVATFRTEADLCRAFIAALPEDWVAYSETAGFDILLVRKSDGAQIGIEAKLSLNAKVITQAAQNISAYMVTSPGPDFRAVMVPVGKTSGLSAICDMIGLTVITVRSDDLIDAYNRSRFYPSLPRFDDWREAWWEFCPAARCRLPDYVPDVEAGHSAPVALTPWKIKAIKIAITLERRGFVVRGDFKHLCISMSRWTDPHAGWLVRNGQGGWVATPKIPDFRTQHPVNYAEIEADFETWATPMPALQLGMTI